ncbi:DUF6153 family protein [Streptomyces sp. NPDC020681]|uniref:DUF6153 family protein n=1 Tax=Streptomyces sp. NPDC020681 TaxID=3365083 RepID=UPI00378FA23E
MAIGRCGRWGLLVALLFGIATMHTVGHPSPSHGTEHAAPHAAPEFAIPAPPESEARESGGGAPSHLNPAAVCLAVLGSWGVELPAAVAWFGDTHHAAAPLGPGLHLTPPQRPPPRTRLAQLSVLRI